VLPTTHLHRPSAADDALAAVAGVKSGLEVYSLRMRSMICARARVCLRVVCVFTALVGTNQV
jgi:hypothetical protein